MALDWAGGLAVGGDSGSLLGKGDPAKSLLLQVVRHEEPDMKMPKGGPKLSPEAIADFEKWVTSTLAVVQCTVVRSTVVE